MHATNKTELIPLSWQLLDYLLHFKIVYGWIRNKHIPNVTAFIKPFTIILQTTGQSALSINIQNKLSYYDLYMHITYHTVICSKQVKIFKVYKKTWPKIHTHKIRLHQIAIIYKAKLCKSFTFCPVLIHNFLIIFNMSCT